MSPADGLRKSGAFGEAVSGENIANTGVASATAGGVPGADVDALKAIIGASQIIVKTAEVDALALATRGKQPTVYQPGGVDLSTLKPEDLEGKEGYRPKGFFVEDEDVPKNANQGPSVTGPN